MKISPSVRRALLRLFRPSKIVRYGALGYVVDVGSRKVTIGEEYWGEGKVRVYFPVRWADETLTEPVPPAVVVAAVDLVDEYLRTYDDCTLLFASSRGRPLPDPRVEFVLEHVEVDREVSEAPTTKRERIRERLLGMLEIVGPAPDGSGEIFVDPTSGQQWCLGVLDEGNVVLRRVD